ncbi:MAG: hypothetical protein JW751_15230 [Polyangiaceae bacterium]|nr:hypothetical protein [Polyangiaceae bacterium]
MVMLSEALIGVKPAWAYIVGGVAGAAGGGVGGYYAEQQSSAKLSLYLLAGGMALAIPTTIAVLSRTAYEPPVEFTQDTPPADEPVAEPPQPSDTVDEAPVEPVPGPAEETRNSFRPTRTRRMARASRPVPLWRPPALLGLAPRGLVLSVPMVEVREVFSRRELYEYGVKQETELHVPVVSASF